MKRREQEQQDEAQEERAREENETRTIKTTKATDTNNTAKPSPFTYSLLSPRFAPALTAGFAPPTAVLSATTGLVSPELDEVAEDPALGWVWLLDWRGRSGEEWEDEEGGGVEEADLVGAVVEVEVEGTRNSGGGFCFERNEKERKKR